MRNKIDHYKNYIVDDKGCWLFQGNLVKGGYGRFNSKSAHRQYYEYYKGKIPQGLHVCHTCDIRNCVNPSHLFTGTNKENVEDKMRKNRQLKGQSIGKCKLSADDVIFIKTSKLDTATLSEKFNVTTRNIRYIKTGRHWNHVTF